MDEFVPPTQSPHSDTAIAVLRLPDSARIDHHDGRIPDQARPAGYGPKQPLIGHAIGMTIEAAPGEVMLVDLNVNRRLRMWRYDVIHSELVLMSTKDVGEYPTRFYVLLKPVRFVSLPTDFQCSRIAASPFGQSSKFEFATNQGAQYAVADHFFHHEDNVPWDAPLQFGVGR